MKLLVILSILFASNLAFSKEIIKFSCEDQQNSNLIIESSNRLKIQYINNKKIKNLLNVSKKFAVINSNEQELKILSKNTIFDHLSLGVVKKKISLHFDKSQQDIKIKVSKKLNDLPEHLIRYHLKNCKKVD